MNKQELLIDLLSLRADLGSCIEKIDEISSSIEEAPTPAPEPTPDPAPSEFYWKSFVETIKAYSFKHAIMRETILAQAILESGRGTSQLAVKFGNYLGMKYRPEVLKYGYKHYYSTNSEPTGGAEFMGFNSYAACIDCYVAWFKRSPYPKVISEDPVVMSSAENFIKYVGPIYAADPEYVKKVLSLLSEARQILGIQSPSPEKKYRVLLDPGHSERKAGARGLSSDIQEEDLNRLQASIIEKELKDSLVHIDIYDPIDDDLWEIGQQSAGYDMFISLHHNAFNRDTVDEYACVMIHKTQGTSKSKKFAAQCARSIANALGHKLFNGDGVYPAALSVLNSAERVCKGPCVLTESYFVDAYNNKSICEKRSELAAKAIAQSIKDWFEVG